MKHVASLAKVSPATVSRAINSPARVDAATRERIRAAIDQLGYVPDAVARSLRTSRTMQVGMCVPRLHNAQFSDTVEAVQASLREAGYSLRLSVSGYDLAQESADVVSMIRHGVDGVVLIGGQHHPDLLATIRERHVPYVYVWSVHDEHPSVGLDHRRAMLRLTSHVIGMGHRRVGAIMSGLEHNDRIRERLKGITDALDAHGLTLPDGCLRVGPTSSFEAGAIHTRELLCLAAPPTAILCVNDIMATGAMLECQRQGLAIPADISIAGFGDTELARMLSPSLTTVRVQVEGMCRAAVQFLLRRMAGEDVTVHEEMSTQISAGGSCGPPVRGARPPAMRNSTR